MTLDVDALEGGMTWSEAALSSEGNPWKGSAEDYVPGELQL